jgi:peptidoglycan hydrolase-like protein with peptidoglycan-binding domain
LHLTKRAAEQRSRSTREQLSARNIARLPKSLGFDPGAIDGIAGRRTLAALKAYRQSVSRPPAAVSSDTIGALRDR